jgi:hypothetical protein
LAKSEANLMADVITKNFTNSETYTIPANAVNIFFILRGARGGSAPAPQSYYSSQDDNYEQSEQDQCLAYGGHLGAQGQRLRGWFLPNMAGQTIVFVRGNHGIDDVPNYGSLLSPGRSGGSGYHNGGDGGDRWYYDGFKACQVGGGSGGGGSSAFRFTNNVRIMEAGGGGGAGGTGGYYNSGNNPPEYNGTLSTSSTGSEGGDGGYGFSVVGNGGSGGGGGGSPGGAGGPINATYSYQLGEKGVGGGGYYNATYTYVCVSSAPDSNQFRDNGWARIQYEEQVITEDVDWTTRSEQLSDIPTFGNTIGPLGSDPNNAWTTFLSTNNVGGAEPEGTTTTRSIKWKINFNSTGKQTFNTAVDDSADVYIDDVFQFSLNTYNIDTSFTTPNSIDAGVHTLRIEHTNTGGPYGVAMDWTGSVDPEPPTVTLTATDYSIPPVEISSIYKGQSLRLTYSASIPADGDAITANSFTATEVATGIVSNPIATVGNSGLYFPAPTVTTTYTYTATNSNGVSTASVTITVTDDTPVISLTSNRTNDTINRGDNITLTWSATANQTITSTTMTAVLDPGTSGSLTTIPSVKGKSYFTFSATNPSGTATTTLEVTTILLAPTASLTSDDLDNTIIIGNTLSGDPTTLTWSAGGYDFTSYSMTGVTDPGSAGSVEVSPDVSTTYTYTVTNDSGTAQASIPITVYTPPTCTISVDINPVISAANPAPTLTWVTTGDADTIEWIQGPNLGSSTELNGNTPVSSTNSITYQARVSGLGGTVDSNVIELVVIYPPRIDTWDVPLSIDYGDLNQKTFSYDYQYVNISATVTFVYVYEDVDGNEVLVTQPNPISLPVSEGATGTPDGGGGSGDLNRETDVFYYAPTWTEFGPRSIRATLEVSGDAGNASATEIVLISIDEVPFNLQIADAIDKIKDEIAYTPDEDVALSDLYKIEDIDIPVEVKSDYAIQVRINNTGDWENIREIEE